MADFPPKRNKACNLHRVLPRMPGRTGSACRPTHLCGSDRHITRGPNMKAFKRIALLASVAATTLPGATPAANAAGIERIPEDRPNAPFVALAAVPPGYTTYYVSGSVAKPMTPAANGKP